MRSTTRFTAQAQSSSSESAGAPAPIPPCVGRAPGESAEDDTQWFRDQLIEENARPRLRFAIAPNGFYQPNLGPDWRALREQRGTLVTQTRAIYVMAVAYQVSGEAAFREAMIRTADFFIDRFAVPGQPGRWARAVAPDGCIADTGYDAYGQTHAIFSMVHAYHGSGDEKYLEAALRTWTELDIPRVLRGARSDRKFTRLNVAMHAFEALLVLFKATRSDRARDGLRLLGEYIVDRFADTQNGFIRELLDDRLEPDPTGEIRLGHNAETAFLFSRAVDAGMPERFLDVAQRTLDFVTSHGIDPTDGSLPHALHQDGSVSDPGLYWWCQTELLRALAHFIGHRGRDDLRATYDRSLSYVKSTFIDPVHGGWYARPGRPDQQKGDDWNAGYHVAMLQTEVLRLRGVRFQSGAEILL